MSPCCAVPQPIQVQDLNLAAPRADERFGAEVLQETADHLARAAELVSHLLMGHPYRVPDARAFEEVQDLRHQPPPHAQCPNTGYATLQTMVVRIK